MYKHLRHNEQGATMLLFVLALFVLFGFLALTIDMGLARAQDRQDQTAADSAALAAVAVLDAGGTRADAATEAIRLTYRNAVRAESMTLIEWQAEWPLCTDPDRDVSEYTVSATSPVGTGCISFNATDTKVRVKLPDVNIKTSFARIIGYNSISTSAAAEAILEGGGAGSFAIFAISETCSSDYALIIPGGTNIPVGTVHSNNNIRIESPATIPDGVTYRTSIVNEAGVPASVAPALSNPLSSVDMADFRPGGSKAVAAGSNYYDFSGTAITNSNISGPGIYYTNRWVLVTSGLSLNATFIVDNPTLTTRSAFETNGSGYDLKYFDSATANPDKLLVYTNAPYSEQCKPASNPAIHFNGSSGDFEGIIYAPNGGAHLNGSGSGSNILGAVIADTVNVNGTGSVLRNDGSYAPSDGDAALYR